MPEANDVTEMEFLPLGESAPEPGSNPPPSGGGDDDETSDKNQNTQDNNNNTDTPGDITDLGSDPNQGDDPDQDNIDKNTGEDTDNTDSPDVNDNTDEGDEGGDEGGDDAPQSIFASMIENSGVDFDEETREALLGTEETDEGFQKVADTIAEKKAEARLSSFMEQYPHTSRMLQYEMNGGDPQKYVETYFPEQSYQDLEVAEDDLQTQKKVVRDSLELQGLDEEDIEGQIQDLEDAGLLHKNAERSLKALKRHEQKQIEEFEQEQQDLQEQRQKEMEEQYNQTVEAIDQGEIEGVKIPDQKKDEFKQYIFEPVNEQGMSQAQVDSQNLDIEQRLLIAYLNFSGYNLDEFVKKQTKNSEARNIREAINKSNNKENLKGKGQSKDNSKPQGKPEDIVSPFI